MVTAWFGDLSIPEVEQRLGVSFSDDVRQELSSMIQHQVSSRTELSVPIGKDKIHIFEAPFCIMAGSRDALRRVLELAEPNRELKMKATLNAAVEGDPDGASAVWGEMWEARRSKMTPRQIFEEDYKREKSIMHDYPDLKSMMVHDILIAFRKYKGIYQWEYSLYGDGRRECLAAYPYIDWKLQDDAVVHRWHIGRRGV